MTKSIILKMSKPLLTVVFAVTILLLFGQSKLIYYPRGYATYEDLIDEAEQVKYRTGKHQQTAFLYPKQTTPSPPQQIWWLFGGNGSTALDWLTLLETQPLPAGYIYLLYDYPGYGFSEGKPSPERIYQSIEKLHQTLQKRWQLNRQQIAERSSVLGHSLGSAVGLHTMATYQFKQMIAVSPFTTMTEVAAEKVGPLAYLIHHRYNNRTAIKTIVESNTQTPIKIYHGKKDSLIPWQMGQDLAENGGDQVQFHGIDGYGHNDILYGIRHQLATHLTSHKLLLK